MNTIKYKIAGTDNEGLIAVDRILNVTPGDRPDSCYISVAGKGNIKADNTVAEIEKRMAWVADNQPKQQPEITVNLPEQKPAQILVNVPPAIIDFSKVDTSKLPMPTVNVPAPVVDMSKVDVSKMPMPTVNLPAPVVNLPEVKVPAPIVNFDASKIPAPIVNLPEIKVPAPIVDASKIQVIAPAIPGITKAQLTARRAAVAALKPQNSSTAAKLEELDLLLTLVS